MPIKGQEWMVKVCEALGFEPGMVSHITIELDAREKVSLTIEADARHSDTVREALGEIGKWVQRVTLLEDGTERQFNRIQSDFMLDNILYLEDDELNQLLEERRKFREPDQVKAHAV